MVCGGWHQAIIRSFDIPIRCQDLNFCGRGASRVRSCTCPVSSFAGPSNLRDSSGKSNKRTISRNPVKRRSEVARPPPASQQHPIVEDLCFSAALDRQQSCKKSRRIQRKRRAALFSRVNCHNCHFVSVFGHCSVPFFAVIGRHQPCETVVPLLIAYLYLCSHLIQSNKKIKIVNEIKSAYVEKK